MGGSRRGRLSDGVMDMLPGSERRGGNSLAQAQKAIAKVDGSIKWSSSS